jgi:hypothetical protein
MKKRKFFNYYICIIYKIFLFFKIIVQKFKKIYNIFKKNIEIETEIIILKKLLMVVYLEFQL